MSPIRFSSLLASVLLSLFSASLNAQGEGTQSFAERLGWGAGDRVLIINCDDAGMSHESNRGAIEGIKTGTVTGVSVMMPCPWVGEFVHMLKNYPDQDIGVHLTHTAEWDYYRWGPVAGLLSVPGLVDAQGSLWDGVKDVVKNASPDEVETEIRAQIARAEMLNLPISHIDSHMWVLFANEALMDRYVEVAIEKQLPMRLVGGPVQGFCYHDDPEVHAICSRVAERVWEAGLPVLDDLHTSCYGWKTLEKEDQFIEAFKNLKPGVTEMVVHLTEPTDAIDLITDHRFTLYGDYHALTNPRMVEVLKEEGIILTTWKELKQRRAGVGR